MSFAFQLPLPLLKQGTSRNSSNPLNITPVCCTPSEPAPRARRLSLPTLRERRYLNDHQIRRAKGRASHFTRTGSFSLMVWYLIGPTTLSDDDAASFFSDSDAFSDAVVMDDDTPPTDDHDPLQLANEDEQSLQNLSQQHISSQMMSDQPDTSDLLLTSELHPDTDISVPSHEQQLIEPQSKHFPSRNTLPEIPPWAYVVRIRASKANLGKRAVQRNRAKRRIRAAAAQIFPQHARRGMEYIITASPQGLIVPFSDIVSDVSDSLRACECWVEEPTLPMLKREIYCRRW